MSWLIRLLMLTATSVLGIDPNPVQNLTTEARSSEIRLSWSALSPADLPITRGYRICSPQGSVEATVCTDVMNTAVNEYTLIGLDSCTRYPISVMTLGDNNTVSTAANINATTAPSPVVRITVSRKDDDTITATWNYNEPAGRSCAALFDLSLCNRNETNCITQNVIQRSGTQYTAELPKSRDCNAYHVNIVVLDSQLQRSNNYRFYGNPDGAALPEDLKVTNINSSSFDMSWVIPASQSNCDYTVFTGVAYRVGISTYLRYAAYDGGRTEHRQSNITSCTACNVSVSFESTDSETSARTIVYTLPEEDKIFDNATVTEVTASSVNVSWIITLDIDQCVDVYDVCWRKENTSIVNCGNTTSDNNNYQVTGLEASTKYQISVAAILHTGAEYDNVTLEATTATKSVSGSAGRLQTSLIVVSAITICMLTFYV